MKFSEMTYTRPDIDALLADCKALAAKAAAAPDGDALVAVYYEQSRAFADYTTASNLANIHYTCDTRDAYWKAEQDFFDANGPAVSNASVEISRAFLSNPHVDALTKALGTTCVAGMKTAVLGMDVADGRITAVHTNRGTLHPALVINAAGVFAEDVARMADDRFFSIHPRRGTNSILDRKAGAFMHSIASVKGNDMVSKTHSKGGGILHTVHDNLLIGPDAVETYEKENTATHPESIAHVFEKQKITMPALTERDIITYFTGVRAPTFEEDFIIERGRHTHNLIHVAGIQSPGLTTAPAVAVDVADMAVRILARERPVPINPDFDPHRPGIPVLREMDDATRAEYIAKNPDYGVIVCRCEEISRGEILDALRSNVCVPTVDGVKKRVRPGMGRGQGGFCSPQVVRIIAEYLGVPLSAVRKSSADAPITFGPTKSGEVQA